MKEEKEFKYIINLLCSDFSKKSFLGKNVAGCKKDYERYLGVGERNKEFYSWLNELVVDGSLVPDGFKQVNGNSNKRVRCYVVEHKVLLKRLQKLALFDATIIALKRKYLIA